MDRISELAQKYAANGFVSPVRLLTEEEAGGHRVALEAAEEQLGPLHYVNKIHTVMQSPFELATMPAVLDLVEQMIGPDILIYSSTYIIKEPGADAYVAWHQDLTYWGLADDDAQVSMWLALAPASVEAGCMAMIPGSHRDGRREHVETPGDGNLLLLGQQVTGLDTSTAVTCDLEPGEASFHHGWTLHTSAPNTTGDRRIGLNVQYVAPHNRQAGADMTATLVRGEDRFGYYLPEPSPTSELDLDRAEALYAADAQMKRSYQTKS